MDIFEAYLSSPDESTPTFSAFFQSTQDLKESLGTKGYLLDHYLSMCFRLIAQIDFVSLQDEVSEAMATIMRSISDAEAEKAFSCQEASTKQVLWLLSHADSLLEQAYHDFIQEKTLSSETCVDIIDLRQTGKKNKSSHWTGETGILPENVPSSFSVFFCSTALFTGHDHRVYQEVSDHRHRNRERGFPNPSKKFWT